MGHTDSAIGALEGMDWPDLGRWLSLSPQQVRIIRLIATEDLTTAAIAARLGVGRRCIEMQLSRAGRKLGVRSRAAIVARVLLKAIERQQQQIRRLTGPGPGPEDASTDGQG